MIPKATVTMPYDHTINGLTLDDGGKPGTLQRCFLVINNNTSNPIHVQSVNSNGGISDVSIGANKKATVYGLFDRNLKYINEYCFKIRITGVDTSITGTAAQGHIILAKFPVSESTVYACLVSNTEDVQTMVLTFTDN